VGRLTSRSSEQTQLQPTKSPSRLKDFLTYLGPAFVASVAYMDPGNFATNLPAGAQFGYNLLWVLFWSNLMAILLQSLSAKLGIATGRTLPENCRAYFSKPVNFGLWILAEIAAMATDLAEFLGAALGFQLLFHWPLLPAALVTGVIVFAILSVEMRGFRRFEYIIMAFVGAIGVAYAIEIFWAQPDWGQILFHLAVPYLDGQSAYLAVGMLGATVMPHVIYLHSALVLPRATRADHAQTKRHFRFEIFDVVLAMNVAWLINSAMVIMAAALFFRHGLAVDSLEQAHQTLTPLLGSFAAFAFGIALLCSGLSSSTVGTLAGQVILQGFLNVRFSIFWRRLITMIPALVVIALGVDSLQILIFSQVALSFALPGAIIPLILLTRNQRVMGEYVNCPWTTALAWAIASVIIALNLFLLAHLFLRGTL
jgi:manganese transport protein